MALDDKAKAVLEAATKVFLEHGFTAATTDMIQREAGVSKATVYARYANKEALFQAVIHQRCALFTQRLQTVKSMAGDLRAKLTELGRGYLQLLLAPENLAFYRVLVAEAPRFPELARMFYVTGPKAVVELTVEQLNLAVQQGEINVQSVGVHTAAELFINCLRGTSHIECLTHPHARVSEAQIDHWVDSGVTLFLQAFGTQR